MSDTTDRKPDEDGRAEPVQTGASAIRRVRSDALLGVANEVIIEHAGDSYRLRCTSNGKLILTK